MEKDKTKSLPIIFEHEPQRQGENFTTDDLLLIQPVRAGIIGGLYA